VRKGGQRPSKAAPHPAGEMAQKCARFKGVFPGVFPGALEGQFTASRNRLRAMLTCPRL
jgi:hypothetical protein